MKYYFDLPLPFRNAFKNSKLSGLYKNRVGGIWPLILPSVAT